MSADTGVSKGGRPSSPRPVRELVETAALFVALILGSLAVVWFVKALADRRLDRSILTQTIARTKANLERGATAAAEDVLIAASELRPKLGEQLFWEFADQVPLMPRYAARGVKGLAAETLAGAEWALRQGDSDPALALLSQDEPPADFKDWVGPLRATAAAFQRAAELPEVPYWLLGSGGGQGGLPDNALLGAYGLGNGAPRSRVEAPTRGDFPYAGYLLGVERFYEGRDRDAVGILRQVWRRGKQEADLAYWLGVVSEARNDQAEALGWYATTVSMSDAHLAGAQAYLRLEKALNGAD